jgi:hypothetical protein
MNLSFGEQLVQFAQSADTLNKSQFRALFKLVTAYTSKTLNISVTNVLIGSKRKQALFLLDELTKDNPAVIPLTKGRRNNESNGHAAYAYRHNQALWIVACVKDSANDGALTGKSLREFENQWPMPPGDALLEPLPKYRKPCTKIAREPIRTSVLLPLRNEVDDCFGVLALETSDQVEFSRRACDELEHIADAVSICFRLWKFTESQLERTNDALSQLDLELRMKQPKLTKPKLFLASPGRDKREDDVIECIKNVVRNGSFESLDRNRVMFRSCFDLEFWEDADEPGDINEYLVDSLNSCKHAICYLSEKNDQPKPRYRYNLNVIFEAGMMHLRTSQLSRQQVAWIPVREKDSEDVPFDFSQERAIVVPRDPAGELNVDKFERILTNRLKKLLKDDIKRSFPIIR